MKYYGLIFPLRNGRYAVEFPDIPEAFSEGETLEECLDNAYEVLAIAVEEYKQEQKAMPPASSVGDIWKLSHASEFYGDRNPEEAILLFPQSILDSPSVNNPCLKAGAL